MCAVSVSRVKVALESIMYHENGATDLLLGTFPRLLRNGFIYFVISWNHCWLSWTEFLCFLRRCHDCGAILEEYDEETLGLAIVVLSTFIHLSPDLAAPLLLDIMQSVGRWLLLQFCLGRRRLIPSIPWHKTYQFKSKTFSNLIDVRYLCDQLKLILKMEWTKLQIEFPSCVGSWVTISQCQSEAKGRCTKKFYYWLLLITTWANVWGSTQNCAQVIQFTSFRCYF